MARTTNGFKPCLLVIAGLLSMPALAEPEISGWRLQLDNDALGLLGSDENYSLGGQFAFSGRHARDAWFSLDPVLGLINRGLWVDSLFPRDSQGHREHAFQVGGAGFTPQDLDNPAPIPNDHPYGCLLFLSNTRVDVFPEQRVAYLSNFLVGLLGTDVCKAAQRTAHDLLDLDDPRGWSNQISDGGEPTARWSLGRQQLLHESTGGGRRWQLLGNLEAAAGMTTQVGAGVSWRLGRIHSPWWGFNPQFAEYFTLATPVRGSAGRHRELYLWGGGMLRYRVFNALIQGQFRESHVEIEGNARNQLLAQAWLGLTAGLDPQLDLSLVIRISSREVDTSESTVPLWGSLILRRTF